MAKQFPMTESGLKKLQEEQNTLESEKRPQAKQRIKRARSFCDFNEDSEYDKALEELAAIEDRIATIQYMKQHAYMIEKTSTDTVEIGSVVTLQEIPDGDTETYTIVGTEEADPSIGKISYNSPIAKRVLGAGLHDEITIDIPNGRLDVVIIDIT